MWLRCSDVSSFSERSDILKMPVYRNCYSARSRLGSLLTVLVIANNHTIVFHFPLFSRIGLCANIFGQSHHRKVCLQKMLLYQKPLSLSTIYLFFIGNNHANYFYLHLLSSNVVGTITFYMGITTPSTCLFKRNGTIPEAR